MAIVQQPDSLSLSGNLKDFKITSVSQVSFTLMQGSDVVLAQTYDPGDSGMVTVSLKNIISGRLSFLLQETSDVYEQTGLAAEFTAIIDSVSVTFTVVRCGVDRLADTPSNFLKSNFLTWQPQTKHVTYSSPEYLTYFAVVPCNVKLKAYFTGSNGEVTSEQTITIATLPTGKACTIPVQYAIVAAKLGSNLPAFYDVWVENSASERITYIQRYVASGLKSCQEQWILFENSLGGLDAFRAYGSTDFTGEHTHNIAHIEDEAYEYRIDTERKFAKNTGHLTGHERRWLLDFFPSAAKYIIADNVIRRIVVTESNVSYTDKELPSDYTFTYIYADSRPFLNLPRSSILPDDDLNIVIPYLGSFTVPPRLVEFPHLFLTVGALFPVQSPFSEQWNVTTMGAVFDYISGRILESQLGAGGPIDVRYLRKDRDDVAQGTIAFEKSIRSADYVAGMKGFGWDISSTGSAIFNDIRLRKGIEIGVFEPGMLGSGAAITADGDGVTTAEVDKLIVRRYAKFFELIIERLSHIGGQLIISPARMECNRVEEFPAYYRCYFDTGDNGEFVQEFVVGDQARCQVFTGSTMKYYWRLVTGIGSNYIDLSKTDCDSGSDIPAAGDHIVQLGNRNNPERQNAQILSSFGEDAPSYKQYSGINSYSLTGKYITGFTGNGNQITGIVNILPGSSGWQSFTGLPEEIQKAADVDVGAVNLILNSGFTGDYESLLMNPAMNMNVESELFNRFLIHWDGNAKADGDAESASGYSCRVYTALSQELYRPLIDGERYVLSFRAKGTISVAIGLFSHAQTIAGDYEKVILKFEAGNAVNLQFTGDFTICEIQLERGTVATGWAPSPHDNVKALSEFEAIRYISDAIKGNTSILGGLILTSMVQLGMFRNGEMEKITAGISGIYNDDSDIAFWAGGRLEDAIRAVFTKDNEGANAVITHGGKAIFNEAIIRGIIYATGGVFKGTVYAEDGVFKGKVYAEDGEFTGAVNAKSGKFHGSLSFPFINIDESDAIMNFPLPGIYAYTLLHDFNIIITPDYLNQQYVYLPVSTDNNGALVNIFVPLPPFSSGNPITWALSPSIRIAGGDAFIENLSDEPDDYEPPTAIKIVTGLFQFCCLIIDNTPRWVVLNKPS